MSVYKVRHAKREDAPQALELIKNAIISELGVLHNFEIARANFLDDPFHYAICEYEGELVGIRNFYLQPSLKYIDPQGKESEVKNVWCSGLVYIKPEHTRHHLRFLMKYLLLQDIVASKNPDPFIYAMPGTEWGEKNLIEHKFTKIGAENIPQVRPPNRTEPFSLYRGNADVYFKLTQEDMKQVKVLYEFGNVYKIRHATLEDGEQILPLLRAGLIEERGETSSLPLYMVQIIEHFRTNTREFFVAEWDGKLVALRNFCAHGALTYIESNGKRKTISEGTWGSGLLYVLPEHREKKLRLLLNYLGVSDIVASKPRNPFLYAIPATEAGEKNIRDDGYKQVGEEDMPSIRPASRTTPLPVYRIHTGRLLKRIKQKLREVKIPYEFC